MSKPREPSRSPRPSTCSASSSARLAYQALDLGDDLEQVAHDAKIRDLEDRCFGILVDGDDGARILDAGEVLDRARDAHGDVELRGDDLAGLADLHLVGRVAGIHRRA